MKAKRYETKRDQAARLRQLALQLMDVPLRLVAQHMNSLADDIAKEPK